MNVSSKLNNIAKETITITRSIKPRSRKPRTSSSQLKDIPSFQQFMHRQQVIQQYRDFFKAIRTINDDNNNNNTRKSMENEVRISYKRLIGEQDSLAISMAVKEGERRLKEFKSMVGYVDVNKSQKSKNGSSDDADSWLNIDDKDDPRGRVGTNWPWDENRK